MPVRAIHGVGKATEQVLATAGITTIADLQDYPRDFRALVGSFASTLKQFAFGEDHRALELGDDPKSISSENTFLHDTADRRMLRECLREQAADVAASLHRKSSKLKRCR
jgi:DNA polymerase-4